MKWAEHAVITQIMRLETFAAPELMLDNAKSVIQPSIFAFLSRFL